MLVFLELISNEVLTDLSFPYASYSHIWTLNNIPVWKSTELPSDLVAETPYAKLSYCKIHLSQTELCSYSGGEMGSTTPEMWSFLKQGLPTDFAFLAETHIERRQGRKVVEVPSAGVEG